MGGGGLGWDVEGARSSYRSIVNASISLSKLAYSVLIV